MRRLPRSLPLSVAFSVMLLSPAWAARWEVLPSLGTEETYTDNVRLAPPGSQHGDWVTQLRPGVSVTGTGARLRLNALYAPQILYRAQEKGSNTYHFLDAKGEAELVQKLAYVDAQASVTQQNISLLGPQAVSNVNVTGNRTSLKAYSISPFLRRDFGSDAHAEARFTHRELSTDGATAVANSQSDATDLRLTSGPAFRLQTWHASYLRQHIHNSQSPDVDIENYSAGGRRLITPNFGVLANVGYDNNSYVTTTTVPRGAFWNVGPEWTPTPRTRLAATAGRRHFGKTRSLDFSHRTRLTTWSATYSEDVTMSQILVFVPTSIATASLLEPLFVTDFPDPVARQRAIQEYIALRGLPPSLDVPVHSLTQVPFLIKRLQGSVGILGLRNTVLASLSSQTREATSAGAPGAGDFAASSRTVQTVGSVNWTLRMSAQTTSNLNYGFTRNELPGLGREDRQKFLRASLTRQFLPRVTGSLNYRWLKNDSNVGGAGYAENAVTAAVQIRF